MKPQYSEGENLSHLHFAQNIFHIEWSGLNPRFRDERLAANCLSHCGRDGSRIEKCRLRGRPETFGSPRKVII